MTIFGYRHATFCSKSCVMVPFSGSNDRFRLPSRNFLPKILRDGPVFTFTNFVFCYRPTLNLSKSRVMVRFQARMTIFGYRHATFCSKSCVMVPFSCSNDCFRLPSRNFLPEILRDGPFSGSNDRFQLPSRNFLLKIPRDGPVFMLE